MNLNVVPEFWQSMTLSGVVGSPFTPSTKNTSPTGFIVAPIASHALTVAHVSSEIRGLMIREAFDKLAITMAR
jgi:hypothetical protein